MAKPESIIFYLQETQYLESAYFILLRNKGILTCAKEGHKEIFSLNKIILRDPRVSED